MGEHTSIGWTDHTYNPWRGCHKVSQGCKNCYMFREQTQYGHDPNVVVRAKPATFNSPLKWKEPARVFTCSWSDFFIEEADPWREEAWDIIRKTPHLTYQILTKRPERINGCLPRGEFPGNVWWGVTIEDQDNLNRWDVLESALHYFPAKILFASVEPLIGPVDLSPILDEVDIGDEDGAWWTHPPDQVIFGGESGPGFRPMDMQWLADGVAQCKAANIPVYVKQDAGLYPGQQGNIPDELWNLKEFPE